MPGVYQSTCRSKSFCRVSFDNLADMSTDSRPSGGAQITQDPILWWSGIKLKNLLSSAGCWLFMAITRYEYRPDGLKLYLRILQKVKVQKFAK